MITMGRFIRQKWVNLLIIIKLGIQNDKRPCLFKSTLSLTLGCLFNQLARISMTIFSGIVFLFCCLIDCRRARPMRSSFANRSQSFRISRQRRRMNSGVNGSTTEDVLFLKWGPLYARYF